MILGNHGVLTTGKTIAGAFNRMYYLEWACRVQIAARSMNAPLQIIPRDVAVTHERTVQRSLEGDLAFRALYRLMEQRDPTFAL